jgi:RloB-like protein
MGSDDLHHKRNAAKLERKANIRFTSKRILVVCEDTKSALYYLQAYWKNLHKNENKALAQSVIMKAGDGSSPDKVLQTAEDLASKAANEGDPYDVIYCVMDVDAHETLKATLHKIRANDYVQRGYKAIVSNPCFEYWVYLHVKESDAPFSAKRMGKSSCDCVIDAIKKIPALKNYQKASDHLFESLNGIKDGQGKASTSAKRFLGVNNPEDTNPSTNFYELLNELEGLLSP